METSKIHTLDLTLAGQSAEPQAMSLQVFHMDGRRLGPQWALAVKPGDAGAPVADEDLQWPGPKAHSAGISILCGPMTNDETPKHE